MEQLNNNKMYIDGKWIAPSSEKLFLDKNPADESEVGTYYVVSRKETTNAINAAEKAFKL
jgi:acyl-CoA reductase-like NAD-dependent aldehyde dehydrogenase